MTGYKRDRDWFWKWYVNNVKQPRNTLTYHKRYYGCGCYECWEATESYKLSRPNGMLYNRNNLWHLTYWPPKFNMKPFNKSWDRSWVV